MSYFSRKSEKLRRGFAILKGSWAVLRGQPELMVLPIVSTVAIIVLVGLFVLVEVTTPGLPKLDTQLESLWFYVALVLFFVVSTFVVTFCNSVLIYCAIRSFEGGRATFGEGLAAAAARWPQLLGWSIMTVMLGSALKMYANIWRRRPQQRFRGWRLRLHDPRKPPGHLWRRTHGADVQEGVAEDARGGRQAGVARVDEAKLGRIPPRECGHMSAA